MGIDKPGPPLEEIQAHDTRVLFSKDLRLETYEEVDRWIGEFQSHFSSREEAGKAIAEWLKDHQSDIRTSIRAFIISPDKFPYREFARSQFLYLIENDYPDAFPKDFFKKFIEVNLFILASELPAVKDIQALRRWNEVRRDSFDNIDDDLTDLSKAKGIDEKLVEWFSLHKQEFLAEVKQELSKKADGHLGSLDDYRRLIGASVKEKDAYYPPPVSQDIQIELEKVFSQHLLESLDAITSYDDIHRWVFKRGLMKMNDVDTYTKSGEFKNNFPDTDRGNLRRELVSAYLKWWDEHGPAVMREIVISDRRYAKMPVSEMRRRLGELALPAEVSEKLILQRRIELGDPAVQPVQTRKRHFGKRKEEE